MKRIQLWVELLKQIHNEVLKGNTSESIYYQYCSKFMPDIIQE